MLQTGRSAGPEQTSGFATGRFAIECDANLRKFGGLKKLIARLAGIFYISSMNRFKDIIEWNAFGVCSAIGNRMGIATTRIRQYFIYASLLTVGSPIIIYMVLAFWRNMRKYVMAGKRNPWYYQ